MATFTPLCFFLSAISLSFQPLIALSSSYAYTTPRTPDNLILNTIDSCGRSNSKWGSNRQALADCAVGFGKDAIGGKFGPIYEVTDSSDDPVNPKPGTLRYGVIQTRPLWIVFAEDMVITLENDAFLNGAYFVPSGYGTCAPYYSSSQSFSAASASLVPALTLHAGPLICIVGEAC